jgi:predicted MFS family arabinose efflux permease
VRPSVAAARARSTGRAPAATLRRVNPPTTGEPPPPELRPPDAIEGGGASRLLAGPAGGALAVLTATSLLGYLDRAVVAALFESLRADLWLTDARLGFLGTGFVVANVLASQLFAGRGHRRSRPALLALGVGVWSVATILSGLARGYWTLLAARAAVGVGQAVHRTVSPELLADRVDPDRRGRAYALLFAAIPIGAALGYAMGGLLDRALGWRAAFLGAGAAGLALAAACLRLREPPRSSAERARGAGEGGIAATWRRLSPNRPYVLAVLGHAAYTFAVGGMWWWTPAFLERTRGVPRTVATVELGAIVAMTGLLGIFLGGHVAERLRRRLAEADLWVCGISALAAAPAALAAFTAWHPGLYLAALVVAQLLLFASTAPASAAIVAAAPPAERAGGVALSILAIHLLGDVPSPWLIGLVSDHSSLGRAVLVVPVAILAAGAIWTYAAWRGERRPPP